MLAGVPTTAAPGRWRRARTAAAPRRRRRRRRRGGRCAAAVSETVFFLKSKKRRKSVVGIDKERQGRRGTYVQRYILALLGRGALALSKRLLQLLTVGSQCIATRRWDKRVLGPERAACPSLRSFAPPATAADFCRRTPAQTLYKSQQIKPNHPCEINSTLL